MSKIKGVLFDLDGVLADTADLHFKAWSKLALDIGVLCPDGLEERLKGVDRMTSLDIILEGSTHTYSYDQKRAFADKKNTHYVDMISILGPDDILPGAFDVLQSVSAAGLKIALASASRNGPRLVKQLGIRHFFDYIADPVAAGRGKPAPDIFLAAASGIGLGAGACLGVEDSVAGVTSIKAAGMKAIGVGAREILSHADFTITSMVDFDLDAYLE